MPASTAEGSGVLVVVMLSILAVGLFGLGERGVSLVGVLPQGFPPLTIPAVGFSDLALLLAGALGIALVSLADTISTATAFAARTGQVVDGNREMVGIGAANIGAGLFQGPTWIPQPPTCSVTSTRS